MDGLFVSAFVLGIAFCAPPGAVTAEALRRGLACGFGSVLRLQLGSLVGDAFWAALALAGAAVLVQQPLLRLLLGIAGALLLLRLAWHAGRDARLEAMPEARADASRRQGDFATGAALSLANPFAVAFWLGVGGAITTAGLAEPQVEHFVAFFAAFMLAALLYCLLMSALVAWCRRVVTPTLFRAVNAICAAALAWLGLSLLLETVQAVGRGL